MLTPYNFKEIESSSLAFWKDKDIYAKAKAKNAGKKKFYFLAGPPYTSGNIHIGHAWNAALKDMTLRYKRMQGLDVWDRWGYDMHGLPTENKVQKELGLKTKDDIIAFGVDKFVLACRKFAEETMHVMNEDFRNLGVWMDFESAYQPIKNEFISGEWFLIKKAWETKRLYQGKKSMTWDKVTETAHAKHELEYKTITDTAIFVKFKVKDTNDYLIVWTTTPWTIPLNLLIMAHPQKMYVKAKVGEEYWILSKDLIKPLMEKIERPFEIVEEFLGEKLNHVRYEPFFQIPAPQNENIYQVVMAAQFVDDTSGTGLVHCAPGCGTEDFEVGQANNVPAFNMVNERGVFENMGEFDGLVAKDDDQAFIEKIEQRGALVAKEKIQHEYPHSWRSHEPVIFRATNQWFMRTEDLKEQLLSQNKEVNWVPENVKESFERWISNLRDNAITRQRFWGCPVPIWEDEDGNIEVIGSLAELKEKAITPIPDDLHKPFIDEVKLRGPTGKEMRRIPDVLDVWLDSGTVSWNCLNYPEDTKDFDRLFPADFILEAAEQARLWFTMLQICSAIAFGKSAFKNVYSTGMILDWHGEKMSKSLGNIISPNEVLEKHGADVFRYYVCGAPAGKNMNFTWEEAKLKQRNVNVLWNVKNFCLDLANQCSDVAPSQLSTEDKYILSLLNSTIKEVTASFEKYELDAVIGKVEELFLELSRTYIQMVRDKASLGTSQEKQRVLETIKEVIQKVMLMIAPIIPLTAEQMYQDCKELFECEEESVHMLSWPKVNEELINKDLEEDMHIAMQILQAGLAGREQANIGLRWPIKEVIVQSSDARLTLAASHLESIIQNQLNVKKVVVTNTVEGMGYEVKMNHATLGKRLGKLLPKLIAKISTMNASSLYKQMQSGETTIEVEGEQVTLTKDDMSFTSVLPENLKGGEIQNGTVLINTNRDEKLELEGFSRELMRRVQQLRKDAGLQKQDRINLHIQTDFLDVDLYSEHIGDKCGAKSISITQNASEYTQRGVAEIKDKKFVVYFDLVRN